MIALPVTVLLRNKQGAEVQGTTLIGPDADTAIRMLQGHNASGGLDLWFMSGKWNENATPHGLDIVGFVNPDGSLRPLTNEFQNPK